MIPSTDLLPVAVAQAASILFDADRSLNKLADLAADAQRRGAQLMVFPEAFIGGYPYGFDFGARIGYRTAEGREQFRNYHASAIEVPGPKTERLGAIAKSTKLYLVIGVIERAGGTLYCTVLFFDDHGILLGKHRKVMPTALERLVWGFGDGSTLTVVETEIGRIGAAICWENYMPALRLALYAKGIELYCAPTADSRETWLPSMRHVAMEGRCFVLSACQYLTRQDIPESCRSGLEADGDVLMRGGSCIVDPLGDVLAGPHFGGETILHAPLDMNVISRGKYDFDVTGHYARPDIFGLRVNENVQVPVRSVLSINPEPFDAIACGKANESSTNNPKDVISMRQTKR